METLDIIFYSIIAVMVFALAGIFFWQRREEQSRKEACSCGCSTDDNIVVSRATDAPECCCGSGHPLYIPVDNSAEDIDDELMVLTAATATALASQSNITEVNCETIEPEPRAADVFSHHDGGSSSCSSESVWSHHDGGSSDCCGSSDSGSSSSCDCSSCGCD